MNDALRMQISAFVDGELPENESELLLRRLSQDAELRRIVDEFMQIGRLMRRDAAVPHIGRLRARIAEALGEEAIPEPTVVSASGNRYLKPVAGFAVAASVALVAIFALQQTGGPSVDSKPAVADTSQQATDIGDQMLDQMFRHHDSALATYDELAPIGSEFDEVGLTQVEPKAQLVAPIEFSSEEKKDDEEKPVDESETK